MYNKDTLPYWGLLCLVILSFSTNLLATDQIPEVFIYKGDAFYFNGGDFGQAYPLYSLSKHEEYMSKLLMDRNGEIRMGCQSTGCYRGYRGTWQIENNMLYLSKLEDGCFSEEYGANLQSVFGSKYTNQGVEAFWVTDTITLTDEPFNSSTITYHFSYLTLIIEKGKIIKATGTGPFFAPNPADNYIDDKYSLASNQLPEIIIYEDEQFYAKGEWDPLYKLLEDEKYLSRMDTNEYGELELSSCLSMDCYRLYQAIWEISNDTLYLKNVQDCCTGNPIFNLEKIFGKKAVTPKGVQAFWIDQLLITSSKPVSEFESKDNAPSYLKLKIEKGIILEKEIEK